MCSQVPSAIGWVPGEPVPGEVVVYFADDPRRLYQLRQWLPVFELLDRAHPVLVVTHHLQTYAEVGRLTRLRRVCVPNLAELVQLYGDGDPKAAIYVNNSVLNFHSLAATRMIHIHVNHGESDKVCMASNQAKAYDRVLVAGEAALRRYREALIEFDERKFVQVGRPQLDLRPEPVLPPTARRTVLYAPTWEGEDAANNFTSIDVHGPAIAAAALALPDVRVVYKPHPRLVSSTDPGMAAAHRRIVGLVEEAAHREPAAGHQVLIDADILAVFRGCSVLITDVSSVGLDFLYLHVDKPLFVADRRNDRARLNAEAPVSRCADVVDAATVSSLTGTLAERLARDAYRVEREAMRRYYFGDLAPGESTERFLEAVEEALAARQTRDRRPLAPQAQARRHTTRFQPRTHDEGVGVREIQIIILAAGLGTRLGLPLPKPLTPLANGRSILRHQLDNLRQSFADAARIAVVVGFRYDLIMGAAPEVRFVYNERYDETNTARSLLKALRTSHSGGVLWLNGDVVFDPRLLERAQALIESDRTFACVNTAAVGEEEVKYRTDADGYLTELSKSVIDGRGEAVGINYVASADKAALIEHLERCTDQDFFERGMESAIKEGRLRVQALDISDCFAVDVDFADDLERANTEVSRTVTPVA